MMHFRRLFAGNLPIILFCALATSALFGCRARNENDDLRNLRGLVTYQERMTLPATARLEVELMDRTVADATPEILGRTVVENVGQAPIGFLITFNATKFEQGRIYAVQAAIYDGSRMLFTTDEVYPADLENLTGLLEIVLTRAD